MTTDAPKVDWADAQEALRVAVTRLTTMLRALPDSDPAAVGQWSLSEVAMHLSQAWMIVPGMARRDLSRVYEILPGMTPTASGSVIGDLWELGDMTKLGVASDPERDLGVLADSIDQRAAEYFTKTEGLSPDERRVWLVEGSIVPRVTLTCHLLNETVVHGFDIARAAGVPWTIERREADMIIAGFIIPVMQALDPRAQVDQQKAAGMSATYDVRLRGGSHFTFVFDDGELHIEPPSGARVDCHLSADPVAMLLVAWGRTSQWSAIAKGQLVAWGRKPWLGPRFRAMIRNP